MGSMGIPNIDSSLQSQGPALEGTSHSVKYIGLIVVCERQHLYELVQSYGFICSYGTVNHTLPKPCPYLHQVRM